MSTHPPVDVEILIQAILLRQLEGDASVAPKDIPLDVPLLGRGVGLDSLDAISLAVAIEREFDIEIDDDELDASLFESIATLGRARSGQALRGRAEGLSHMKTLPEILDAVVARHPGKTAIVDGDRRPTYLELQRTIRTLAGRLHALGVRPGDSIAVMLPNGADFVAGFFAVADLGAVVVPLNVQYRQKELDHFIRDSGASVLITSTELEGLCRSVDVVQAGQCRLVLVDGARNAGVVSREGLDAPTHSVPASALICQYSSGSTGAPKRIVRTHANLTFELDRLAAALNLSASDRFLGVAPFSHVNGLVRSMLASMSVGGTLVTLSEFSRRRVAEAISREHVTVFIGVPFMFSVLSETRLRNGTDLSSLRLCVSASAPMPVAANERFHERFGRYVLQLYGSTETGTISVSRGEADRDILDSVGVPIDGVELGVFSDDGAPVDAGEIGEVAIKSPAAITRIPKRLRPRRRVPGRVLLHRRHRDRRPER